MPLRHCRNGAVFGSGVGEQEISMAQIQEHLLQFRTDPVGAAQNGIVVAQ